MASAFAERYAGLSIRDRIVTLVLACVLPAWLYVAYMTFSSYQHQRSDLEAALQATTQNLLRKVEAELAANEAIMQVLSSSVTLENKDFAAFDARARTVLRQTSGLNIVLLGSAGEQIVNTLKPYGEKLPTEPPPFFESVHETGRPVLSDLFIGPVVKQPLVSMAMPVFRDDRVAYVLGLSLDAKTFAPILHQKGRPDTWVAGIFDTAGTVVARSHFPEKYVGRKGVQAVLESRLGPPEGLTEATILEGTRVVLAYSRSERYGWTAVIAVPKGLLEAEVNRSLSISLVTGATVLLAGLLLAGKLAHDITVPIRALISPAIAIGNGEPVTLAPLGLKEAEEVAQSLVAAAALIRERTNERDLARTHELELSLQHKALRALSDITTLPDVSAADQLFKALGVGRRHLGLKIGIISRVEADVYTVLHHDCPPDTPLSDGQTFELGKTYCAITLNANDVVAIPAMAESLFAEHPCHQAFGLESYIGAPVWVRERRFGTVNFSSSEPLGHGFDKGDIEFMRVLAQWVGSVLERDFARREILAAKDAAEEAQRVLAVQAQSLIQSNADLEQFAYVASHDLQSPLRNVVSYAQLLELRFKGKLGPDGDDFIAFIVSNATRMSTLIWDLLDYARVSRQPRPLQAVPAERAVTQALSDLTQSIEANAAVVTVSRLPVVLADEVQLSSLFQNLIGNAVKFRRDDHAPRITISAEPVEAGWWRFRVVDNGIGIDPEYNEKIFSIFQRLHTSETYEGSGIGLALCRRIVNRFGGTIWVESTPGEGASFFFTLRDGSAAA